MFSWLKPAPVPDPPRLAQIPEGLRLYAIGDVHGRLDCLNGLLQQIENDSAGFSGRRILIGLGDYIDRGPDSRGVVERFMSPMPGFEVHCLRGNHEQTLLNLFDSPEAGPLWLTYGGRETLLSYGIPLAAGAPTPARMQDLQERLQADFPAAHRDWMRTLPTHIIFGDYFFTHAGVRPGIPLDRQSQDDLLWIRDAFLHYRGTLDKVIIHGHSISDEVEIRAHRIGIDTGAYASGRLTALVLEGETRRLLQTAGDTV